MNVMLGGVLLLVFGAGVVFAGTVKARAALAGMLVAVGGFTFVMQGGSVPRVDIAGALPGQARDALAATSTWSEDNREGLAVFGREFGVGSASAVGTVMESVSQTARAAVNLSGS